MSVESQIDSEFMFAQNYETPFFGTKPRCVVPRIRTSKRMRKSTSKSKVHNLRSDFGVSKKRRVVLVSRMISLLTFTSSCMLSVNGVGKATGKDSLLLKAGFRLLDLAYARSTSK